MKHQSYNTGFINFKSKSNENPEFNKKQRAKDDGICVQSNAINLTIKYRLIHALTKIFIIIIVIITW